MANKISSVTKVVIPCRISFANIFEAKSINGGEAMIDFPENNISIESFYDRLRPCYDSVMQFGDRVLVAQMNWNGMLEGAVYGFVEDPEEGWSPIECRLELLKISDEIYTDAGHAIEWCIKNAH